MKKFLQFIRRLWNKLAQRQRSIIPKPEPIPLEQLQPSELELTPTINRAERRRLSRYERLRRKHDKFVVPKGPRPERKRRQARINTQPTPDVIDTVADADDLIGFDEDDRVHENDTRLTDNDVYEMTYEREYYGEYHFRDTILDQLDLYFVYLRRMRLHDPDAYNLYKQVGITVLPPFATFLQKGAKLETDEEQQKTKNIPLPELSPWFRTNRPAFGCFAYGITSRVESDELTLKVKNHALWVPKFLYFEKYKDAPPTLQRLGISGDIYALTIWWDRPHDKTYKRHGGVPEQYGIFISDDGKHIQALKVLDTKMVSVKSKRELNWFRIPNRAWRIPNELEKWAKLHGDTANGYLSRIFLETVARFERSQYSMVRVSATKGDLTATFGVHIKRTAYFFQDRDIQLTPDGGSKKRIFHIVRPHTRQTKNGATTIPMHFRGLREFEWAGYKILITVPGKHHVSIAEFNVGATDEFWIDSKDGTMNQKQLGRALAEHIRTGAIPNEMKA